MADACAVFAELMVDREHKAVGEKEAHERLDQAIQNIREENARTRTQQPSPGWAARQDWTELQAKLEALRQAPYDSAAYKALEDEIWKESCQGVVGT